MFLLAAGFAGLSSQIANAAPAPHKLRVTDATQAKAVEAAGGKLIADYGGFKIYAAENAAAGLAGAEAADEMNRIELNAGVRDTSKAEAQAARKNVGGFAGRRLHLVQFAGPVKPEWFAELEQNGVQIVSYIPNNAYLVYGDTGAVGKLQSWASRAAHVQWDGAFEGADKIHPHARTVDAKGNPRSIGTDAFTIQLVDDAVANAATLALIDQLKLAPIVRESRLLGYLNLVVRLPADKLADIAAQPEVVSIHPYFTPHKFDERQGQIMAGNLTGNVPGGTGYLAWLAGRGFTQAQFDASGFVVDVTDSGIDNGTTNVNHFALRKTGSSALAARVAYSRLEGTPNTGSTLQGCDGHGNLNAHIIAGYSAMTTLPHLDSAGYHYGLGICPFVKVGSSVIFDSSTFTSPSYPNLQSRAYRDAARISNNSWGADTAGAYDSDAQAFDALVRDAQPSGSAVATAGNQQMVIVFAAGNAGSATQTVGSPGTAKNVIVVGASESVRSHSIANGGNDSLGNDGCTTPDTEANSAADVASFSSRGPCADGRQKPDIMSPGTHITGGVGQTTLTTNGTGTALTCFTGEGVCGLPGGGTAGSANNFFPLGQQFYTTSSGTSHATPGVAGACALVRQYFINAALPAPSPAMTKAVLANSARYLTGTSAGDSLPSPNQGMGAVNLGPAFDGVARVLRDETAADKFTASGQTRTFNGVVADSGKPFRVTLAWTDAPGATSGNAYNNNLDLTVTIGGNTYKGNVFSGANSSTGGTADAKNNLESVFLPAGVSGAFTITITAANIVSDGVPNEAPSLDQDFALVVYNASQSSAPVISADSYALTAESCVSVNGAVDPGETVTVNFALHNVGAANTSSLVATLLATNGVTAPGGAQSYGVLVAGGAAVTQAFSFTATGACGSTVTATLSLSDNGTNLGRVTFTIPLGQLAPIFIQNFDGVTAPALPSGWTSTGGGGMAAWKTATTASDTAPNAAFSPDAATAGSNSLVSATVTLLTGSAQLTFRHRYELEPGFDGGVLEIKIGAGAFTDILAAGGSFVSGGYVQTLDSGNPLGARQAWTGTNASFSTVVVNLPSAAAGQTVQFRWRCASDSSESRAGWWVDSVTVSGAVCCGAVSPPFITGDPQSQTVVLGDATGFAVSAIGQNPLSYHWHRDSLPIANATNSTYNIASTTTNDAGSYFVIVTNVSGSVTSLTATLTVVVSPVIMSNPASLTVSTGSTAGFSVTAIGAPTLSYQWQFNNTNIAGANSSSYAKTNVQVSDAGNYTVVVSNYAGSVTSAPGVLSVVSGTATGVVISQVYGGGGNSGATYRNDYVELYNAGGGAVSLAGWSVQYSSAAGTTWSVANLQNSIQPGQYYLVRLASGGASGAVLPAAEATNTINISAANGKIALVTNQTALTGANPVGTGAIMDFVGYGTAGAYEGTAAAPAGGSASAILRKNGGATDTGDNAADFIAGPPNPRHSGSVTSPVDLVVAKSHSGSFTQGDAADNYTITVTNLGSLATTGTVSVVDTLPAGLTATAMSGSGWSVNLGTLTATRADALAAGAVYPAIAVTVSVATNAAASVINSATVSGGGDANAANNTATDPTTILTSGGGGGNYAGVLAGWEVSGQGNYGPSPFAATSNAPNVTVVGLTRGSGVGTANTGATNAWGGSGFVFANEAAAIAGNSFVTFSVTPGSGATISFTNIPPYNIRHSSSGSTNGIWQYQVGGGTFTDIGSVIAWGANTTSAGNLQSAIDLSGISALQNVAAGTTTTFRIVLWGGTGTGSWYVNNLTGLDLAVHGTLISATATNPPAIAPTLAQPAYSNSQFQFTLNGTAGSNYIVQAATNLGGSNWIPVRTNPAPFLFTEPNAASSLHRFYRGLVAP